MKYVLVAVAIFLHVFAYAQPHIRGKVIIDMKNGLLDCDFKVSRLPELGHYRILLNHGMNVQYFTSDGDYVMKYEGYYDGKTNGEALEYVLLDEKEDTLPGLPKSFGVKYRGAFPIYAEKVNNFDFKGYIAFNGKTVRAAEQSKWYPVIYDVKHDRILDGYSYDIEVQCDECRSVFINGSVPQQKKVATFRSETPRALLLFAGQYDFISTHGNYLLNANVDTTQARQIFKELDRIKAFHAKNIAKSYQENIYLISHQAVKPYTRKESWGFTVFPTFAYAGVDFNTLIDSTGHFTHSYLAFFAHELSHYYFGTDAVAGTLQWFWLESTTEYLSLKAVEALTDVTFYHKRIARYAEHIKDKSYQPLAKIKAKDDIDSDYRYVYGPLILLAFERQFGQATTYKVLADIIKRAEKETITLATWRQAALANKVQEKAFDAFYTTYLASDRAIENIRAVVAQITK